LDGRDRLLRGLVARRVHHPGRVQDEQPRLLDPDARLRDAFLRDVVLAQRLAEGDTLARTAAHQLERALRDANLAHAVVDAPRAEPSLRNLEAAPLAEQQ